MRFDADALFKKAKDQLKYPFSLNINPFMDPLAKESLLWLQKNYLLNSSNKYQKILFYCPWVLSSYTFPNVSFEFLSLVTNWFSWVFLSNDEFIEKSITKDPLQISIFLKEYRETIYLKKIETTNMLIPSLMDIMHSFSNIADEKWLTNFQINLDNYFEACLQESFYRVSMDVPSVIDYCKIKILSSGMLPIIDMIELSINNILPVHFKISNIYSNIINTVSNICAWANDIYSFPIKIKNGDPCNLLTSIMTHESLTINEALDKAIMMHNFEIEKFISQEKEIFNLSDYNEDEKKIIQIWFDGLKSSMIGIWCWTLESGKHQFTLNDNTNLVFFEDSSNDRLPS